MFLTSPATFRNEIGSCLIINFRNFIKVLCNLVEVLYMSLKPLGEKFSDLIMIRPEGVVITITYISCFL